VLRIGKAKLNVKPAKSQMNVLFLSSIVQLSYTALFLQLIDLNLNKPNLFVDAFLYINLLFFSRLGNALTDLIYPGDHLPPCRSSASHTWPPCMPCYACSTGPPQHACNASSQDSLHAPPTHHLIAGHHL
jgi:hypothetical protein